MILGHVVGTVWCTRKHPKLGGLKLLVVQPYFVHEPAHDVDHLVAVDTVDAGVGDDVVVCLGAPARRALGDANFPVEAAVMGVVDRAQLAASEFGAEARRPLVPLRPLAADRVEWI